MKSRQQTFDKVVSHLRAQGRQACCSSGSCMYRAPDGSRCAAGILIADEHYSPALEGRNSSTPEVIRALVDSGVSEGDLSLVDDLQAVHDGCTPQHWEGELARVARVHRLEYAPCPTK